MRNFFRYLNYSDGRATFVFALIFAFYTILIFKYLTFDKEKVQRAKEYAINMFNSSSAQYMEQIDLYINYDGKYSGVIPYVVSSGYDKNKIILQDMGNYLLIRLPSPEVKIVERTKKIKFLKKDEYPEYINRIYKYGDLATRYYLLKENKLKKIDDFIKGYIDKISKMTKLPVVVETTDEKELINKWTKYTSVRCGVDLDLPKELEDKFVVSVIKNKLSPYCIIGKTPDGRMKFYVYNEPLKIGLFNVNPSKTQLSIFYPKNIYSMNFIYKRPRNSQKYFSWDKRYIRFKYKFKDKNLVVDFKFPDESSLKEYLPSTFFIASLINQNGKKLKKVHDCFGIVPEIWFNSFTGDKQHYVESYFQKLPNGVVFDYKNHVLTTIGTHQFLYEAVKKASELVPKGEVRGHLIMAILSRYGEKFENTILYMFLDNKIIAVNNKGEVKRFSYETLVNASLDSVDLGFICLDKGFCIGDLRDKELVPEEYRKEYKAQRNLAKVVWKLANYGFPQLYQTE